MDRWIGASRGRGSGARSIAVEVRREMRADPSTRRGIVAKTLQERGFTNVEYYMEGGSQARVAAGLPTGRS